MTDRDPRPYFAISNDMVGHPKFKRLSDRAVRHLLVVWTHCNVYLTDGEVDHVTLLEAGQKVAKELLDGGWVTARDDGTYYCHDWLKHQKSKAEIEGIRADKSRIRARSGKYGSHVKWHVKRSHIEPGCEWCEDTG